MSLITHISTMFPSQTKPTTRRIFFAAVFLVLVLAVCTVPVMADTCLGHGDGGGQLKPWNATAAGAADNKTSLPTSGSYYLVGDVNLADEWKPQGEVHLCLNGYVIKAAENKRVATIGSGDDVHIYDCKYEDVNSPKYFSEYKESHKDPLILWVYDGTEAEADSKHTLYGGLITRGNNTVSIYGGGVYVNSGGKFTLHSGNIAGNAATYDNAVGGGVCCYGGTFTMHNGTIAGNKARGNGGGVSVQQWNGNFEMFGGTISNNSVNSKGGGVYCQGNFNMRDGIISDNIAYDSGGGVAMNSDSSVFTLSGGTISRNTAGEHDNNYGGGVWYNKGKFTLSGDGTTPIIITENRKLNGAEGVENNVFLTSSKRITINNDLLSGSNIGVTLATGTFVNPASPSNAQYFSPDKEGYLIGTGEPVGTGEPTSKKVPLLIGSEQTLEWNMAGGTVQNQDEYTKAGSIASGSYIVFPKLVNTDASQHFYGWDDGSAPFSENIMPNSNLTLMAVWGLLTYYLDIPTTFTLTEDPNGIPQSVGITLTNLHEDYAAALSVQSENGWNIIQSHESGDVVIPYQMTYTNPETRETATVTGNKDSTEKSTPVCILEKAKIQGQGTVEEFTAPLTFTIQDPIVYSGTYTDSLVFTVEIVEKDVASQQSLDEAETNDQQTSEASP